MSEDWRNELVTKGEAIDALGDMVMNWTDSEYELGQLNQWKADRKAIIDLPSAQPQWIPCSERLPEEKKDVLIAFKHNMAVGFWEDILDCGEPVWYANSGDGWFTDTANVDSDGIPLAWMPLPEPYAERREDA